MNMYFIEILYLDLECEHPKITREQRQNYSYALVGISDPLVVGQPLSIYQDPITGQ